MLHKTTNEHQISIQKWCQMQNSLVTHCSTTGICPVYPRKWKLSALHLWCLFNLFLWCLILSLFCCFCINPGNSIDFCLRLWFRWINDLIWGCTNYTVFQFIWSSNGTPNMVFIWVSIMWWKCGKNGLNRFRNLTSWDQKKRLYIKLLEVKEEKWNEL